MDDPDCPLLLSEEDFEDIEVVEEDWEEIRDESSRAELFDESRFEGISRMTEENSNNESKESDTRNVSDIIDPMTGNMTSNRQ